MFKTKYIFILVAILCIWQCKTPDLLLFNYPDDIAKENKKKFAAGLKQGNILYNLNCAKCHNIKLDNRDSIPTFSLPQLLDYEIRFQYTAHQDSMTPERLTNEDLEKITTFLRYHKNR